MEKRKVEPVPEQSRYGHERSSARMLSRTMSSCQPAAGNQSFSGRALLKKSVFLLVFHARALKYPKQRHTLPKQ